MKHNPRYMYKGPVGVLFNPLMSFVRRRGLFRVWAIWKFHRLLWHLTRSDHVRIVGHELEVDRADSLALASGSYEPEECAWYEQNVGPRDVVVEAGGNVGFFSTFLARLVGPDGRIVTFEPDPRLAAILRRNANANGYSWIDIRESAVADKAGTMTFFRARRSQGDNRLFSHDGDDAATFPVQVVTLDDELADLDRRIDLLKMDIQGAEPLALAGFAKTLAERPPRRMLVEWWPHGMVGMGHDPRWIVDTLRSAGYRISALGSDTEFDVDQALVEMTPENLKWVNLVATHQEADRD